MCKCLRDRLIQYSSIVKIINDSIEIKIFHSNIKSKKVRKI